jgi:hypothetical protein
MYCIVSDTYVCSNVSVPTLLNARSFLIFKIQSNINLLRWFWGQRTHVSGVWCLLRRQDGTAVVFHIPRFVYASLCCLCVHHSTVFLFSVGCFSCVLSMFIGKLHRVHEKFLPTVLDYMDWMLASLVHHGIVILRDKGKRQGVLPDMPPITFFGHDFGSTIVFELIRLLKKSKTVYLPVHHFITSGCRPAEVQGHITFRSIGLVVFVVLFHHQCVLLWAGNF